MGNVRIKLLRDRRGYSMTFWAVFIGLVLIPALAFAIELGRYFYAISEVQKLRMRQPLPLPPRLTSGCSRIRAVSHPHQRPGRTLNPTSIPTRSVYPLKGFMLSSPAFR